MNWIAQMRSLAFGLLAGGLLAAMTCGGAAPEQLVVVPGSTSRVSLPEAVRKIFVAAPTVARVIPAPDDDHIIMVTGVSAGETEVTLTMDKGPDRLYTVVVRRDLQGPLEEIRELIGKVDGLEIKAVGTKVVLEGDIFTARDYERIKKVAAAYPGIVFDQTHFDQSALYKYIAEAIRKEIGYDGLTVRINDDTVYLEGDVLSETEKVRAEEVAKSKKFPVRNFLNVAEVSIETDIVFLDVSSESGKAIGQNLLQSGIGISPSATMSGGGELNGKGFKPASFGWSAASVIPDIKIQAALDNNKNRSIVRQFVTTKNGSEGRVQAGGEQGVAIAGNVGGSMEKVPYGVILRVKPTLQGRDRVISELTLELSEPKSQSAAGYVLDKSETSQTVACRIGESVVLSGLTRDMSSKSKNKTPFLGDVPLLNLFFAKSSSGEKRREIVMVMTPRILSAVKSSAEQQSEAAKRLLDSNGIKQ